MFLRRSLILFTIGVGIGLPWLVRDWLNSRAEPSRKSPIGLGQTRTVGPRARLAPGPEEIEKEREESAQLTPYPLASQTRRLIEGFFGGKGTPPGPRPEAGPSSTPRTRAIVEATAVRLEPELSKQGLKCGDPVVLRLFKEEQELEVWMKPASEPLYLLFKVHRIAASAGRPGPKLREGDGQAPEGFYEVTAGQLRPHTKHHLGLDLGYPNARDRQLGRSGEGMMIHAGDSAAGAYALSPEGMEEIYTLADAALRAGHRKVPVHLFPFRLTDKRMDQVVEGQGRWMEEWIQLKEGYDFFENVRRPPVLGCEGGHYVFQLEESEI